MRRRLVALALAVLALSVLVIPAARAADEPPATAPAGQDAPSGTDTTTGTGRGAKTSRGLHVKPENGIAGGGGHGLAINDDGELFAWGYNRNGQLGTDESSVLLPTRVSGVENVSTAAGGEVHSLVIIAGKVWAFGSNEDGQLGQGKFGGESAKPVEVRELSDVTAIAASGNRSYAITDGRLFAWGDNEGGRIGLGSDDEIGTPKEVPGIDGVVVEVAAGGGGRSTEGHSLALTEDGTVYSWGTNAHGQLGNGLACTGLDVSNCKHGTPKKVAGLPTGQDGVKVDHIAAAQGADYSMALLSNGKVMAWGDNERGQLGRGTMTTSGCKCLPDPDYVHDLDDVDAITASGGDGVALTNGEVWVWGDNTFGQLGNGAGGDSPNPGPVENLEGVTTIASGGGYILARKQDGAVFSWGINGFGEVGVGNTDASIKQPVPTGVPRASQNASIVGSSNNLLLLGAGAALIIVIFIAFRRRQRRPVGYPNRDPYDGWGRTVPATARYSPPLAGEGLAGSSDAQSLEDAFQEYGRRVRLLSRVDLFESASHDMLTQLAMALRPLKITEGDVICREGDIGDEFFLVESGTLAITTEVGDRTRELARLGSGEFFGESALLGEGRRTATVVAVTDGDLWAMSAEEFAQLLERRPEIDELLRRTASQRSRTDRVFEVEEHSLDDLTKDRPGVRIGRHPDNEIVFESPLVSGHHAVIEARPGGSFTLRDLGSLNGSYLNRVKIRAAELHDGDVISIGDQSFVFDRRAIRRLIEPEGIRLDVIGLSTQLKDGKQLLNNIDLSILPGEFVAIVGGSGAGKTTLLQALSGVQPATTGQVLYSGRDYYANIDWFRSQLGYVPQDDIIHTELPLGLTMRYSAELRLPSDTSSEQLDQAMSAALEELDLADHVATRVGDLSGGQRKRCSIGVELLTQPRIFFLDEPTSGLDPYTDTQMVGLLRRLADKGSTVVLTTHATKNVMLCDKVVFLARGGQLAFVGTPHRALRYFEADSFDEIYRRLAEDATPEEWGERFRASEDFGQVMSDQLRVEPEDTEARDGGSFAENPQPGGAGRFWHQLSVLSRRNRDLYVKNPKSIPSLVMPPVLFTLLALTLFRPGAFGSSPESTAALQILFLIAFSAFIFGLLFGVQSIVSEFPIFQRERMVNLGILPYVLSKLTFLVPVLTAMLVFMIVVLRFAGRLPDTGFDMYWQLALTIVLTGVVGLSLALLTSAFVSNSQQATDSLSVWIMPQVLFAGALLAVPAMNFIGRMISAICPVRWSFEALGQIADLSTVFRTDSSSKIGAGLTIQYAKSFTRDPIENWIILGLFIVIPLAFTCLVLQRKTTPRRVTAKRVSNDNELPDATEADKTAVAVS